MTRKQADRIITIAEQAIDCYEGLRRVFYRNAKQDAQTINKLIEMLLKTGDTDILDIYTIDWLSDVHKEAERTLRILAADIPLSPDVDDYLEYDFDEDMEETAD